MSVCPYCGNQAAENAIFCDQCGTRLPVAAEPAAEEVVATEVESTPGEVPEGILICPSCGAENVPGEVFCDACGEPLEAPEPVPSEAVAGPAVAAEVELETVLDAEPEVEVETVLEAAAEAEGVPVAVAEQTYCSVCGASVRPGDTFCGTCGASLTEAAEEQSLVEEPVIIEPAEEAAPAAVLIEEETVEPVEVEGEAEIEEPVLVEEGPLEEVVVEPEGAAVAETVVVEVEPEPAIVPKEPLEEVVVTEAQVEEPGLEGVVVEADEYTCPVCGASVLPDQRFCASCGAALPVAEAAVPAVAPAAVPETEPAAPPITMGPYLEVVDSGAHIPLIDQPELLIGRVDDVSGIYPDIDMTPHGGEEGGVSRRHAQLLHEGDAWFVVDLNSTNGSYVNGTEIAPSARVPLQDGDRIGLGDSEVVLHTA
jgi:predicted amidophosphoribosyltransferase